MGEEDKKSDIWGLSLSLRPPINITNLDNKPLCKREAQFSIDEQMTKMHKQNKRLTIMPRMMEMDVKPPLIIDLEEIETSKEDSPNSTLSSSNAKRLGGGLRGDQDVISDEEEGGSGGGGDSEGAERKKLRLSKEQTLVLEQAFREHTTLNTKQKVTLARQVNLRPRQVEVWFQNRRARTKLKQTEVDCEYLRRFCETLTEQNRKLQKEVQELRALKNRSRTAINMCPSCKTVSHPSTCTAVSSVLHRPVPVNLKKLSLTINNNMMLKSHLPHG